jgi:PAS domain S-box-containing protein
MTLSILASAVGFIFSTNATRNTLLDGQLSEDIQRLTKELQLREHEVGQSAELLATDPELILVLRQDTFRQGSYVLLDLDRRALRVRDRFQLDQVMVVNAEGQPRVNIAAQSLLSQISVMDHERLEACRQAEQTFLVHAKVEDETAALLIGCAPIWNNPDAPNDSPLLGTAYTFLNLTQAIPELRRELGLLSEVELTADTLLVSTLVDVDQAAPDASMPAHDDGSYRTATTTVALGRDPVQITLLRSTAEIDAIVATGLQAVIISSVLTLLLLLAVGTIIARSLTHPILKLAGVAQAVAEGDLSRRAHLTRQDEVGQLGRAFDYATATITDLLDQRAREAGKFHAILQSIADGVLAVDTNEQIVLANPAAGALLACPQEHLVGQPLTRLLATDDPILLTGMQQVIDQIRSELVDPDQMPTEERVGLGSRVVRLQSAPTLGSGNILTGAVVIIQDITRAVEAERAKSEFIATASHELRTPLTGIKGFLSLLHLDSLDNLTENQRIGMDAIARQTDYLVNLVNDVLETARFDRGTVRAERRWVDLHDALEEAVASMQSLLLTRQVEVQVDLAPDLAPLWIDGLHLRRILTNIISNAIKYTYQGTGKIHVHAYEIYDPTCLPTSPTGNQPWKHKREHSVLIEVEDNGVGIKAEDQPRIFGRFFRSENPLSVEVGGTGLGLAITHSLVRLHGGQIGFWSRAGAGSCFWVRFPVTSTEPIDAEPEQQRLDERTFSL